MIDDKDFEEESERPASNLLPSDHRKIWSEQEKIDLLEGVINGLTWEKLAETINRKPDAIKLKFANMVVKRINNGDLARVLSASGSSRPPNRDPKKSISGIDGERPSDDRCEICSSLLGPRCHACGNTFFGVNLSQNDFFE